MKALVICMGMLLAATLAGRATAQMATPTPVDCEAVRCQIQSSIDACSNGATNHGQCVSCVTQAVRTLGVPKQCRGKITRCTARSTCGKPNFETCRSESSGTCAADGTCSKGTLAAGLSVCTQDADCVVTSCRVMRAFARGSTPTPGADPCSLLGGTPGTGSCCAPCPTATPGP